jgi:hypothetical protein
VSIAYELKAHYAAIREERDFNLFLRDPRAAIELQDALGRHISSSQRVRSGGVSTPTSATASSVSTWRPTRCGSSMHLKAALKAARRPCWHCARWGNPRQPLEGVLIYVPAKRPETDEQKQIDPFALYAECGAVFPKLMMATST